MAELVLLADEPRFAVAIVDTAFTEAQPESLT